MRLAITLAAALAATSTASPGADRISVSQKDCEVIRILADGRRVRSGAAASAAVSPDGRSAKGSSSVEGPAGGSARSSIRVSSSSSSNGGGSATASSSYTDDEGRTVTTTRDQRGCTIVIDERD